MPSTCPITPNVVSAGNLLGPVLPHGYRMSCPVRHKRIPGRKRLGRGALVYVIEFARGSAWITYSLRMDDWRRIALISRYGAVAELTNLLQWTIAPSRASSVSATVPAGFSECSAPPFAS